ncbi:hypothetical protein [Sulfurovum sp. NBC37-1]|uniref:hypothetical protein n=1 Tax=Sulfurovum sp. (strain NBC37-1) TaxID=387093 RepID=UPI0011D11E4C|nr:hypothetical protein [Sulfurovum sp. NBC37-1]
MSTNENQMNHVVAVMFKTLILLAALSVWRYANTSCWLFVIVLTIVSFFLTMTFSEGRLLYRKGFADQVFRDSSIFHRWLNKTWFVLISSLFSALIAGIMLLLSILHLNGKVLIVMFLDIGLLLTLYWLFIRYFSKHTYEGITHLVARKTAVIVNIVIMVPVAVAIMLYSMPPEFLHGSLVATIDGAKQSITPVSCESLRLLQTYDAVRNGFAWWAMFKASSSLGGTVYAILVWLGFLVMQTFYLWIFSRLILSSTIPFVNVFSKINQYKIDRFSLGFFGVIVAFAVISITFMPDERVDKNETVETNTTYVSDVLKEIDTLTQEERNKSIEAVNSYIDTEVNHVFQSVYANIPQYADRQYVWYRDYVDMYQVAAKKISDGWEKYKYYIRKYIWQDDVSYPLLNNTKSYAQKSSDELQRVLFQNGKFDKQIYDLQQKINAYTQKRIVQSRDSIASSITLPEGIKLSEGDMQRLQNINAAIEKSFLKAKNSLVKTAMAYKVGEVGVTLVLTKTIVAKLLAKSGVKVIAKTGAKTAIKSGGFLSGATTGLAVCAPSGPWALACGAAAGTLTWVGIDFAVGSVDEVLTRNAFEAKLRSEIKRNENAFKQQMKQTYARGINDLFNTLDASVHKRPIDAIIYDRDTNTSKL